MKIQVFPDEMPEKEISINQPPPISLCFGGKTIKDEHGVLAKPPIPNQKKATIGEMIEFAATSNGKFKRGAKYHLINYILSNIEELTPLSVVPWVSRKWAVPAWREIQKIGILDGLELLNVKNITSLDGLELFDGANIPQNQTVLLPQSEPRFPVARIRQLCGLLGIGFNKINGRIVITRKTYTEKTKTKCQADL